LRISIDFTAAIGDRTGIGTYALELVRALLPLVGPDELRLDVHAYRHPGWHAKIRRLLSTVPEVRANRFLPHGLLLRAERALGWPRHETVFGAADVHHGTNYLAPPSRRARIVITVHDLAFVRFAKEIPVPHQYARYIRASVERAHRIIAVSKATRRDLVELFAVEPARIAVIPEGAPASLPAVPPEEFAALRERWGLPERYFLFVGTLEPRKNLPRLVRAFDAAARRIVGRKGLLLLGRPGWAMEDLRSEIRRCPFPIATPGFVPTEVRNAALANAVALVLPSLWEGFGLPVLEAFRAGTPVVASAAGALPEVAGDAALLADPTDTEGLAAALIRMAADPDLRADLTRRGTQRVRRFTWERTARETLEVYRNA
jgi:glycosyltransferase involved in cell wall biosynthesis